MKSLKESLLDNEEEIVNKLDWRDKFLIPEMGDIDKVYRGYYVDWECKELIQQYLNILQPRESIDIKEVKGIGCLIDHDKFITTYLTSKYDDYYYQLVGVGDWVSNNLKKSKINCLYLFEKLLENPDENFKKIFLYNNKCLEEIKKYQICDYKTYLEILE